MMLAKKRLQISLSELEETPVDLTEAVLAEGPPRVPVDVERLGLATASSVAAHFGVGLAAASVPRKGGAGPSTSGAPGRRRTSSATRSASSARRLLARQEPKSPLQAFPKTKVASRSPSSTVAMASSPCLTSGQVRHEVDALLIGFEYGKRVLLSFFVVFIYYIYYFIQENMSHCYFTRYNKNNYC